MKFTKRYADLDHKVVVKIDNTKKTMSVTVDTFSAGENHILVATRPEEVELETGNDLRIGTTYDVVVKDYKGASLFTTKMTPMFAP